MGTPVGLDSDLEDVEGGTVVQNDQSSTDRVKKNEEDNSGERMLRAQGLTPGIFFINGRPWGKPSAAGDCGRQETAL